MNISYNEKDHNLPEISKLNNLNDFKLKYKYRIYGLQDVAENPPVLIEMVRGVRLDEDKLKNVVSFLENKGITAKYQVAPDGKSQIYLGLNRSIRENLEVSNRIINTLVYVIENNIDIQKAKKKS